MVVNYQAVDFKGDLTLFKNERDEVLIMDFSSSIEKIEPLSLLAMAAYESGFNDFALETFNMSFGFLSRPYDYYECFSFLKVLSKTEFTHLSDELCAILYNVSENCQGDLTDKLLLKFKLFEFSNVDFAEILSRDIFSVLFNHQGEYRINQSLSDSLPFFIIYLISNNSIGVAKSILIEFQEYLIQIVEGLIFENNQLNVPVRLKEFCQTIIPDEIGGDKYDELKVLISGI